MKEARLMRALLILSITGTLLPWFTYNAKVMGYCWGWEFLPYMLVPYIIMALGLFKRQSSRTLHTASVLCGAINTAIIAAAPGCWQIMHNITGAFLWTEGLQTALPAYYTTVVLHVVMLTVSATRSGTDHDKRQAKQ